MLTETASTEAAERHLAQARILSSEGRHPAELAWNSLTQALFAETIALRTGSNPLPALDILDQAAALLPKGLSKQVTDRTRQTRAIAITRGF